MAIAKDVIVNIRRMTAAVRTPGFGMPLLVQTQSVKDYKEYSDMSAVILDYPSTTNGFKMASAVFAQEPKVEKIAIVGITYTILFEEVIDSLFILASRYPDWYYLACDAKTEDAITKLSSFADTAQKIYFTSITMDDQIKIPESDRLSIDVHDYAGEYIDCAKIGMSATRQPGSATLKFKTLSGVTPMIFDDQKTTVDELTGRNLNTYVKKYGINMTTEGLMTSGEYIDIILAVDWLQSDMESRVMRNLVVLDKVPYTNEGIAIVAASVEATLRQATAYSILRTNAAGEGLFTINVPDISEVDPNDIAKREFNLLTWDAYLAGAIHTVKISGIVQY